MKLAFIHIPKTGGTYLSQDETTRNPVLKGFRRLGHVYVVNRYCLNVYPFGKEPGLFKEKVTKFSINKSFVITIVRNPFSWLVSYLAHAGGFNPKYRDTKHYDYLAAHNGFDYLVKSVVNRENIWPSRKFLFCQA